MRTVTEARRVGEKGDRMLCAESAFERRQSSDGLSDWSVWEANSVPWSERHRIQKIAENIRASSWKIYSFYLYEIPGVDPGGSATAGLGGGGKG